MTGAVGFEIPGFASFMNLFNGILGASCTDNDLEEVIKDIAKDEDRTTEARTYASALHAHLLTISERLREFKQKHCG